MLQLEVKRNVFGRKKGMGKFISFQFQPLTLNLTQTQKLSPTLTLKPPLILT